MVLLGNSHLTFSFLPLEGFVTLISLEMTRDEPNAAAACNRKTSLVTCFTCGQSLGSGFSPPVSPFSTNCWRDALNRFCSLGFLIVCVDLVVCENSQSFSKCNVMKLKAKVFPSLYI